MSERDKRSEQLEILGQVFWPVAFVTSPKRVIAAVAYAPAVLLTISALVRFVISLFTAYSDVLPHLFIALASWMAIFALHAVYVGIRAMFGTSSSTDGMRASLPERAALVDEKNALLRGIKDIAFERDVGKLSQEEFDRLDRSYRMRAKEVLRKLDEDIAPYLARAERLLDDRVDVPIGPTRTPDRPAPAKNKAKKKKGAPAAKRRVCASCETSNAPDAELCESCGASVVPKACVKCSAENDADAMFCKKCAAPLNPGSEQSAGEEKGEAAEGAS
jgi:ribosomal protein L40E